MSLSNIKVNNSSVIGVDEQPTAGSDNLVNSGNIFKVISPAFTNSYNCHYRGCFYDTTSINVDGYFNENLLNQNESWCGCRMQVHNGDNIVLKNVQVGDAILYALILSYENTVKEKISIQNYPSGGEQIITPQNDGILVMFWKIKPETVIYNNSNSYNKQSIEAIERVYALEDFFTFDFLKYGYYTDNNGVVNDHPDFVTTPLIKIDKTKVLITAGCNVSGAKQLLWYDINRQFISVYEDVETPGHRRVVIRPEDIPANAQYVVLNGFRTFGVRATYINYITLDSFIEIVKDTDALSYLLEEKVAINSQNGYNWEANHYYNADGVKVELQGGFCTLDFPLQPNTLYYFRTWLRNDTMSIPLLDSSKNAIKPLIPVIKDEQFNEFFFYNTKYSYIGLTCPTNYLSGEYFYAIHSLIGQSLYETKKKKDTLKLADIIPAAYRREVKIGFIGDSTTDGNTTTGWTVENGHENYDATHGGLGSATPVYTWSYAYPAILQTLLRREVGNNNITVYNMGYSGKNSQWAYKNINALLDGVYSDVDVIIYRLGINDRGVTDTGALQRTSDNFKYYVGQVIEECQKRGITVIISTTQPTTEVGNRGNHNNEGYKLNIVINPILRNIADSYGLELLDLNVYFKDILSRGVYNPYSIMPDSLHFTNLGHRLEAEWYASKIIGRTWNIDGLDKFGYSNDCVKSDLNIDYDISRDNEWPYYASLTPSVDEEIYNVNVTLTDNDTFYAVYEGDLNLYIDGELQPIASDFTLSAGFHNIRVLAVSATAIKFYGFRKR